MVSTARSGILRVGAEVRHTHVVNVCAISGWLDGWVNQSDHFILTPKPEATKRVISLHALTWHCTSIVAFGYGWFPHLGYYPLAMAVQPTTI